MKRELHLGIGIAAILLMVAGLACIQDSEDSCPIGQVRCNGTCIDPLTNNNYCGADELCQGFTVCTVGVEVCNGAGQCAIDCEEGLNNCRDLCVNNMNNPSHCGACDVACAPHELCSEGACVCAEGFAACDEDTTNGCETNVLTDLLHCGACGVECMEGEFCVNGQCGCAEGFADCDQDLSNGCEVDILNDNENCGGCTEFTTQGIACTENQTCTEGACACDDGFGDCDGSQITGCEAELAADATHCGACGNVCSTFHAEPACAEGLCELTCDDGFEDCDGLADTGCESNLAMDPDNCGACGAPCFFNNADAACTSNGCELAACHVGYKSCDNNPDNGCEKNITSDTEHCGDCNTPCEAGQRCEDGRCLN